MQQSHRGECAPREADRVGGAEQVAADEGDPACLDRDGRAGERGDGEDDADGRALVRLVLDVVSSDGSGRARGRVPVWTVSGIG
jgi:hypothetical protein